MMHAIYRVRHAGLIILGLLSLSQTSFAAGFHIAHRSAAGLSLTNALVADTKDINALAYNPATAVFHDGASLSGTLMLLKPTLSVDPEGGSSKEGQDKDNILLPGLNGHIGLNDQTALVLSVNVPFGLGTEWDLGTFPNAVAFVGGLAQPTISKLEILGISPSVALKVAPNTSLALGVDYYDAREVMLSAASKTNEGSGDGWGYSFALSSQLSDKISIGASYHSQAFIDVEGTTVQGGTSSTATTELTLPWRAQVGVNAMLTDDLSVEFDITRTGWSSYDEITIDSHNPTTSANHWEDVNTYHLGVRYALSDSTKLRFGYSYDEQTQPDEYFSARSADSDRHLFGLGVGQKFADGWNLDVGYMYIKFEDRTINSTTAPTTSDINGTTAYNGTYKTDAHYLGLTVTKQF